MENLWFPVIHLTYQRLIRALAFKRFDLEEATYFVSQLWMHRTPLLHTTYLYFPFLYQIPSLLKQVTT